MELSHIWNCGIWFNLRVYKPFKSSNAIHAIPSSNCMCFFLTLKSENPPIFWCFVLFCTEFWFQDICPYQLANKWVIILLSISSLVTIWKLIRAILSYQLANNLIIYFLIFVTTSYHEIQKDPGRLLKTQEDLERHRKTQVEVDRTNMIRQARRWYFKKTTVKEKWNYY